MTEPRVEAGDRALETARNVIGFVLAVMKTREIPLPAAVQVAELIQVAMNAQERELRTILRARADKAYCDFIEAAKKQECLGYVAKLQAGTFGAAEHKAHKDAAELFGQHKAFAEAERLLAERGEVR